MLWDLTLWVRLFRIEQAVLRCCKECLARESPKWQRRWEVMVAGEQGCEPIRHNGIVGRIDVRNRWDKISLSLHASSVCCFNHQCPACCISHTYFSALAVAPTGHPPRARLPNPDPAADDLFLTAVAHARGRTSPNLLHNSRCEQKATQKHCCRVLPFRQCCQEQRALNCKASSCLQHNPHPRYFYVFFIIRSEPAVQHIQASKHKPIPSHIARTFASLRVCA